MIAAALSTWLRLGFLPGILLVAIVGGLVLAALERRDEGR